MNKIAKAIVVFAVFAFVIVGFVVQMNLFWNTQIVAPSPGLYDTYGRGGIDGTFLNFDKAGNPQITYRITPYQESPSIEYAKWNGISWNIQELNSVGNWVMQEAQILGLANSIALDSKGNPCIVSSDDDFLKYGVWNGSGFSEQIVQPLDNSQIISNSLVLDSNGKPYISYLIANTTQFNVGNYSFSSTDEKLMCATLTGSTWNLQRIDTQLNDVQNAVSIAVDPSGNPHITYTGEDGSLKYANWNGSSWSIQTLDKQGINVSLALDSHGNPHMVYQDLEYSLKYAHWSGNSWITLTIDKKCGGGSLALDSNDTPHISYANSAGVFYASPGISYIYVTLVGVGAVMAALIWLKKKQLKKAIDFPSVSIERVNVKKVFALFLTIVFITSPLFVNSAFGDTETGNWEAKASLPNGFYAAIKTVAVEGKIYAICDTATFVYDPQIDLWTQKPGMPTPRGAYGIAAVQNKIYVIGGEYMKWPANPSDVNEAFNVITGTWETKQPLPKATYALNVNAVNDKIYVNGGVGYGLNSVYDPTTDTWTNSNNSVYLDAYTLSTVVNDKIYFLTTIKRPNTEDMYDLKWYIYNTEKDMWTLSHANAPNMSISSLGTVTGDNTSKRIYAFGQTVMTSDFQIHDHTTYVYNTLSDSWSTAASIPTARTSPGISTLNDKLYVIGGGTHNGGGSYDPNGTINAYTGSTAVEVYTPSNENNQLETNSPPQTEMLVINLTINEGIVVISIAALTEILVATLYWKKQKRKLGTI